MAAITNNMGYEVRLTYADMPKRYDGFAPSVGLTDPVRVVSTIATPTSANGYGAVQYTFGSPKTNTDRKHFYGFTRMVARDTARKTETAHSYRLFSPLGLLADSSVSFVDGEEVGHIWLRYARQTSYRGLPMVQQTRSRTVNHLTGVAAEAACAYDSYGNLVADSLDNSEQLVAGSYGDWVAAGSSIPRLPRRATTTITPKSGSSHADTVALTYDAKGRVATRKQNGVTTAYEYHPAHGAISELRLSADGVAQPRVATAAYDPYGRYPTAVTAGEQAPLTERYAYDAQGWGRQTSRTDALGRTTLYEYDALGRIVAHTLPGGVKATTQYAIESVGGSAYSVYTSAPGLGDGKVYYDLPGREVRRTALGPGSQHAAVEQRYNSRGLPAALVAPTTVAGDTQVVRYEYDRYGRLARQLSYLGALESSYSGLQTTVSSSATGRTQHSRLNANGLVAAAGDGGGAISYRYNARGLPVEVGVSAGGSSQTTAMEYDRYGLQTRLDDPTGAVSYRYNAFGELVWQADAAGNTLTLEYDEHGRVTQKTLHSPAFGDDVFRYAYGDVLLDSVEHNGATAVRYGYNDLGLPERETRYVDGYAFEHRYTYNSLSQLAGVTGPSGLTLAYSYDSAGYLTAISGGGKTLWGSPTYNAAMQLTGYRLGNGATAQRSYTRHGQLTGMTVCSPQGSPILQLGYAIDPATGNLLERSDLLTGTTETFAYDGCDRLTRWGDQTATYAANGNILHKSDAGDFAYGEPHGDGGVANPYAVSSLSGPQAGQPEQRIAYNALGMVATVAQGDDSLSFAYDHEGQRTRMSYFHNGALERVRYYVGGFERTVYVNENYHNDVHYVSAESGIFAAYERRSNGASAWHYLHPDHLGSLALATNAQGQPSERRSYDAWGQPGSGAWHFSRGYTGHEHLPEFGLINMNGRMYDPLLGRMLSPDAYVQAPGYTQSYNRYSYCWNNPLKYTDPTGWETTLDGGELPGVTVIWYKNARETFYSEIRITVRPNAEEAFRRGEEQRERLREQLRQKVMLRTIVAPLELSSAQQHALPPIISSPPPPPPEPKQETGGGVDAGVWGEVLDDVQLGLDVIGLVPGYGEIADAVNAGIYALRGDYLNANLSMAACIPVVGWAATGGKLAGKMAVKSSTRAFRSFTSSNFRHNLGQLTGNIPANSQAHHVFPQMYLREFTDAGINIHNPKFGVWWETTSHLKNAKAYNDAWKTFFRANSNPTQPQILNQGRTLMQQYGIPVGF